MGLFNALERRRQNGLTTFSSHGRRHPQDDRHRNPKEPLRHNSPLDPLGVFVGDEPYYLDGILAPRVEANGFKLPIG